MVSFPRRRESSQSNKLSHCETKSWCCPLRGVFVSLDGRSSKLAASGAFSRLRGNDGRGCFVSFIPVILWSDALVFLLLAVGIAMAVYVRRHEHLLLPWRRVGQSSMAMVSLLVLSLFLLVGGLDTLHYRVALQDKNGTDTVYSPEVLSAFDRLVAPLRLHTEKTYSAPLAVTLYAKESFTDAQGGVVRDYPRLQYGGAHLSDAAQRDGDVMWRAVVGSAGGFLSGISVATCGYVIPVLR